MTNDAASALADELAVRSVLDEYCLMLEVDEFDAWLDLFTDDTVYEVYKLTLNGKQEMSDLLSKASHGVHMPGASRISIDGDRAVTVQSYLFLSTSSDEWNTGWYWRELVRTDGGWKISHTKVKFARKGELASDERAHKLSFPVGFG